MKILAQVVFLIVLAWFWIEYQDDGVSQGATDFGPASTASYDSWRSGDQVEGEGKVIRVLADDNEGSRHQRFILRLGPDRTLLVAHNIDLAPRISSLRTGDPVQFFGQYEWNDKGGVLHWTHHDPQGRHTAGWLKHNGRTYQ